TAPLKYQRSLKNARYTSKDNQPNLAQSNAIVSITPPYKKIYANPRKRWQKPKCYTEFKVPLTPYRYVYSKIKRSVRYYQRKALQYYCDTIILNWLKHPASQLGNKRFYDAMGG